MADGTQTPAAPAPSAPAPAGQPAAFTVPDGHRLVPQSEYETLSRNNERLKGADAFVRSARDLGFERPEDFGKWKDTFGAFKKRGLTPEQLNRVFSDQAAEPETEHRAQQQFDPEQFEKSIMSKMEFKSAEEKHRDAFSRESDIVNEAVSALVDKDASEFEKKRWSLTLRAALDDARDVYPEGHPLRDKYVVQPLTKAHAEKVVASFKKEMSDAKAASLAAKGDAVRSSDRKSVPTGAQPGTGQGKPNTDSRSGPRDLIKDAIDNARQKLNIAG